MRGSIVCGVLGLAACVAVSGTARADETIVVQPPSGAAGTLHARFRGYKERHAFVYREVGDDRWSTVCSAPCEADLPVGARLRVVYDDRDDEPHDFTLDGNAGSRTDVEVRPASKGALAGGIVMTSIGGLTLLVGVVLLAVSASSVFSGSERSGLQTAGLVCAVGGGGLTIGGILLIANRSHEPRIKQDRRDAMLDDGPRRISLAPPAPPTPFGLGFAF